MRAGTISRLSVAIALVTLFMGAIFFLEASDGLRVVHGVAEQGVTAFSICKNITNESLTGRDVYVPFASAEEWLSFRTNPPEGVLLTDCAACFSGFARASKLTGSYQLIATDGTYVYAYDSANSEMSVLRYVDDEWVILDTVTQNNRYPISSMVFDNGYVYAISTLDNTNRDADVSYIQAFSFDGISLEMTAPQQIITSGHNGSFYYITAANGTVFLGGLKWGGIGNGYILAYRFDGASWQQLASYDVQRAYTFAFSYATKALWTADGTTLYMAEMGWSTTEGGMATGDVSIGTYSFDGNTIAVLDHLDLRPGSLTGNDSRLFVSGSGDGVWFLDVYSHDGSALNQIAQLEESNTETLTSIGDVYVDGDRVYASFSEPTAQPVIITTSYRQAIRAFDFDGTVFSEIGDTDIAGSYSQILKADNQLYVGAYAPKVEASNISIYAPLCTGGETPPAQTPECADGVDNDGNGSVDMSDTCGCFSSLDQDEADDGVLCPIPPNTTSVICTELHRQGFLPDEWMEADSRFGQRMPNVVMRGYHFWARPVVSLMRKSPAFTEFVNVIAQPWARQMAYLEGVEEEGSFIGLVEMAIGIPASAIIGIIVPPWL